MKTLFVSFMLLVIPAAAQKTFTLLSNDLGGQATATQVFNGFGCTGSNTSPELHWENAPAGTQSFAVTIFDEDAPTGSGWWHWLIFDVPADVTSLKSGAGNLSLALAPAGSIQSKTDFGSNGYGGPCPPEGSKPHRYVITIYALKTAKLGPDATANPALVGFYLEQNVLQKASIVFYYQR